MKTVKILIGGLAAAALTFAATGATLAWTVPVGTTAISSCTQNGTLSNGTLFTLYTNIYQTGNVFTYQYDLKNVNDAAGLTTMAINFGSAADYGTHSMKMFFGDAPNKSGIVYHDGAIGYGDTSPLANPVTNSGTVDYKLHSPTMEAYTQNGQVVWQTLSTPLKAGQDTLSQLGYNGGTQYGSFGYLYVQSTSKPVQNNVFVADKNGAYGNVTDCAGAPCGGTPPPAVPEPSAVASLGLGGLGLLGLLLRARKRLTKSA